MLHRLAGEGGPWPGGKCGTKAREVLRLGLSMLWPHYLLPVGAVGHLSLLGALGGGRCTMDGASPSPRGSWPPSFLPQSDVNSF